MNNKVGVDAVSFYVPQLYLPISSLAKARGIDPEKLEKGLGLKKMSLNDVNEDTATLAANALYKLMVDFNIDPAEIDRIYLGTESALDGSKPTAIYATHMVEQKLAPLYGERCFAHTDITDITFACVGGVDALQNSLDFIKVNPTKKAIVIAADYAKYALDSTGEYTQGSGAVALLLSGNPRLLSIGGDFAVATESVFDFFKPRRKITANSDLQSKLCTNSAELEIFMDEPIFDGQFSNECYKKRVKEAYLRLKKQTETSNEKLFDNWRHLIFHLPYAYQGKRVFMDIFALEQKEWANKLLGKNIENNELTTEDLKLISQTEVYRNFVKERIEPGQRASSEVGNLYTASIFLSLLSALADSLEKGIELENEKIGFLSYGSGSKSKVFEGVIQAQWKEIISKLCLFSNLKNRTAIDFETYQMLHRKERKQPVDATKSKFIVQKIEEDIPVLKGARYYTYI